MKKLLISCLLGLMINSSSTIANGQNCNDEINSLAIAYSNVVWANQNLPFSEWRPYYSDFAHARRTLSLCQNSL